MYNQSETRPTKLYIDLKAIKYNVNEIRKKLSSDTEIMAVLKANGYGSGSVEVVNTLIDSNVNRIAVALADEGAYFRQEGISLPILILNQPGEEEIDKIVKFDLTPSVSILKFAQKLSSKAQSENKIIKIHTEVDTGAGRIGLKSSDVLDFVKKIRQLDNLELEGIFTHFSCADNDCDYTLEQIKIFDSVLEELQRNNIGIKYKHACNSAGILNYPQAHYNLVRPGIMLHGYYPDDSLKYKINLKPTMRLVSKITFLKEVEPNIAISYNKTFITSKKSKIATIPIGYGDGYKRVLSNKAFVVINNKRVPIVGNICMDMVMADVSELLDVRLGDEVYIFDNELVTIDEIAKLCNTINYEIISTLSSRIPRIYIK